MSTNHYYDPMLLGLTGSIGCGKSTALKYFRDCGAQVVDVDSLVKKLLHGDNEVQEAIDRHFGDKAKDNANRIDRGKLARIIFNDPKEREWLENLLHPRVQSMWQSLVEADPHSFWVIEIPLLFEKKLEKLFDFSVCIASSTPLQVKRLRERGLDEGDINARIANQIPTADKIERADFVLTNNGNIDFLQKQVNRLCHQLNLS